MTFNIWFERVYRGQPLSQTAEVIRQVGADMVGMQEVKENAQLIADLLGCRYQQLERDSAILSRYEIVATTPEKTGANLRLNDGQVCYLCNVHLTHATYQPYQLLNIHYHDAPCLKKVVEEARGHQVAAILQDIQEIPEDVSVFVTGDFNEPSDLDWTEAAAEAGRHPIRVNYPSTRTLAEAGFVDAYRRIHPDEMQNPGYTWPTVEAAEEMGREDRIDFILFRGQGMTAHAAKRVGGDPRYTNIVVIPYPSDHRAVVASFSLQPN